jgi:DNA mismatch repair protein MutL
MRIAVLDEITRDKIAAGEVVERPASVVKELVENALDSGARRIEVRLGAAADEITVADDGCGMSAEDLQLSVQRHATSKLRTADDLTRISSFGFRGEALPSIAAVSELEIRTRQPGPEVGHRLCVTAGTVMSAGEAAAPPGTTVQVRKLFFNTPVRARFLGPARSEIARAVAVVERFALAHPEVAFRCESGDRLVLHTPGSGDYLEALLAIAGLGTAKEVRAGRASIGQSSALALVGSPATGRSDRRRQGVWINRRPVSVRGLLEASEAAYPFGVLPGRRHPLLYLMISVPPEDVDVNVHPAKAEVRLRGNSPVFALAVAAVRNAAEAVGAVQAQAATGFDIAPVAAGLDPALALASYSAVPAAARTAGQPHAPSGTLYDRNGIQGFGRDGLLPAAETPAAWDLWATDLSSLRPLGQVGARWLACDGPGGLFLLDQHAAHERVIFESLGDGSPGAPSGSQPLAVPASVDLEPEELARWEGVAEVLSGSGLRTEHFGGNAVLVREVPLAFPPSGGSPESLLRDVLAALAGEETRGPGHHPLGPRLSAKRALASCTAAIKAHQQVSAQELQALLTGLAACREPWRCPHGRPTVILLSHSELERRFGR